MARNGCAELYGSRTYVIVLSVLGSLLFDNLLRPSTSLRRNLLCLWRHEELIMNLYPFCPIAYERMSSDESNLIGQSVRHKNHISIPTIIMPLQ